jgi:acyl-CoA thioester hydrolase
MTELHETFENTARLAETDATGVLFYGEYTVYLDEAMSEYLRKIDYPWPDMVENGWSFAVGNVELDFRSYTEYGDELVNNFGVSEIGDKSFSGEYEARSVEDGDLRAEGSITLIAIDVDTEEAVRIPDDFREAVSKYQEDI